MEFSTAEERFSIPIFVKEKTLYRGPMLDDYCFSEHAGPPVTVHFFDIQTVQTIGGMFISLGRLLAALFEEYSPASDLFTTLNEVAVHFPFVALSNSEPPLSNLLVPKLEDMGFAVEYLRSYGDGVRLELCWLPATSKAEGKLTQHVPSGVFHFRPRHDGTLGNGTCGQCWERTLPFQLFEILKSSGMKHPLDCLSEHGVQHCLSVFEWQPKHKMPRSELAEKRSQVIAKNRNLWTNTDELSLLLKREGLYSVSTSNTQIKKTVMAMIARLQANESANRL